MEVDVTLVGEEQQGVNGVTSNQDCSGACRGRDKNLMSSTEYIEQPEDCFHNVRFSSPANSANIHEQLLTTKANIVSDDFKRSELLNVAMQAKFEHDLSNGAI